MLGAIVGDIVGSPFEFDQGNKTTDFPLFSDESNFTDDTLMTLAVGQALMQVLRDEAADKTADDAAHATHATPNATAGQAHDATARAIQNMAPNPTASETAIPTASARLVDEAHAEAILVTLMRDFAARYPLPKGGFGGRFAVWLQRPDPRPYGSYGNGSAMRVSSVGWLFDTLEETEHWAEITARVTHNHPEGIKGAQATAAAIFLARTEGASAEAKAHIKNYIETRFGYDLSRTIDEIRPTYHHVESCQESVPEAITAYLESNGFENALRLVVSLGGDTDTTGAITGSIAEAAYGIPQPIRAEALKRLPPDLRTVLNQFEQLLGH